MLLSLFFLLPSETYITEAAFCMNIIYWKPPRCDANCTIIVNRQEVDTIPCSDGSLKASDTDLNNKILSIHAIDPLGRNVLVQNITNEGMCAAYMCGIELVSPA